MHFLKLQPLCGFYTRQNFGSTLDHFWCCSNLFYQINLVMLNNLLFILLILKQIKFTKQRRKRICWVRKIRSSRSQILLNIVVLENFTNFTGMYLCWSLFLIKLLAFNFIKRDLTQLFSCKICEIFKNTCFYRTPPVAASGKFIYIVQRRVATNCW